MNDSNCKLFCFHLLLFRSLCAVPIVVVSLYVGIYVGHWVKIFRAHTDLNNIHSNYLDDPKKGFWVAVLLNPVKDASKDYVFYGEADFNEETMQKSLNPTPRHLVGVIAVDVKDDPDMREPPESVALIKRMTVNKSHQRKGIGTVLLRTALDHCLQHKFRAVELVTTEHHVAARSLYADHGFELQATVQKRYLLWGLITLTMHRLRVACSTVAKLKDKPRKITEAELYSKVD